MKNIWVVTHPEAMHHVDGLVGGWYDSELTNVGRRQAGALAKQLEQNVGDATTNIVASDLKRCTQTASIIADRLGCGFAATRGLREISYGVAEGKPQAWLDERYTPAADDNRLDHDCGIEGAETRRDLAQRVYPIIEQVAASAAKHTIIVTHGFALTFVLAAWARIPIDAAGFVTFPAPSGSITHLQQDDFFRNRSILRVGDTAHF